MSQQLLERAKVVILQELRQASFRHIIITVEDVDDNVGYFQQALELPEVRQELEQQRSSVEFRILDLIGQVEQHMLSVLRGAASEVREVRYPCYSKDADVYYKALRRPQLQAELAERGITARVQLVDRAGPDIYITSLDS